MLRAVGMLRIGELMCVELASMLHAVSMLHAISVLHAVTCNTPRVGRIPGVDCTPPEHCAREFLCV